MGIQTLKFIGEQRYLKWNINKTIPGNREEFRPWAGVTLAFDFNPALCQSHASPGT